MAAHAAELPARIYIGPKDGLVRIEAGNTTNAMNGLDEMDFDFSLRPEDAIELGRRLIGAGLNALKSIDDERRKVMS
jgi:hypothetical protein